MPGPMKRLKPYLYIAPALLVIALIFFYPVVEVLRTSFLRIASGRSTFVVLKAAPGAVGTRRMWRSVSSPV